MRNAGTVFSEGRPEVSEEEAGPGLGALGGWRSVLPLHRIGDRRMWRQTWSRREFFLLSQESGQVWKESLSLQEVDR